MRGQKQEVDKTLVDEDGRLAADDIDNGRPIEPVPIQGSDRTEDGNLDAMRRSRGADDVQLGYSLTLDQIFMSALPVGLSSLSRCFPVLKPLLVFPRRTGKCYNSFALDEA